MKKKEKEMLKKLQFSVLTCLTLAIGTAGILGQSSDTLPARIKTEISRRGTGEKIVIKLKTGDKIEGRITQILDDSFDVTDTKTKRLTTVLYTDVSEARKPGWSRGKKIAVGVGIAVVVTALVVGTAANKGLGNICPLGCGPF